MTLSKGARVVIAIGPARGLRGTIAQYLVPMKPYGKRSQIACDNGASYWFMDHQRNAFFAEDSDEARALLDAHAAQVGAPELEADVAFAEAVVAERRTGDLLQAVERVARHADPRALHAHLALLPLAATPGALAGKPPGWRPPALTAYAERTGADLVAPALEHLRRWFADPASRALCGLVAGALPSDPRLLDVLRELTAIEPERGVLAARLQLGDPEVFADLAATRIVERDGQRELHVGGLTPDDASRLLAAAGDRAADLTQLDLIRGSAVAYDGYPLDAWLAWPELARFRRLVLSESFRGGDGLARVLASPHLSPELEYLDLTGCDIGQKGCKALAAAPRLASLRALRIDAGDYDKTKWGPTCLSALFPANGALAGLEELFIRGWKVRKPDLDKLVASGRASLRSAQVDWNRSITLA